MEASLGAGGGGLGGQPGGRRGSAGVGGQSGGKGLWARLGTGMGMGGGQPGGRRGGEDGPGVSLGAGEKEGRLQAGACLLLSGVQALQGAWGFTHAVWAEQAPQAATTAVTRMPFGRFPGCRQAHSECWFRVLLFRVALRPSLWCEQCPFCDPPLRPQTVGPRRGSQSQTAPLVHGVWLTGPHCPSLITCWNRTPHTCVHVFAHCQRAHVWVRASMNEHVYMYADARTWIHADMQIQAYTSACVHACSRCAVHTHMHSRVVCT